jgi:SAM-dependent methyltransferase
MKRIAEPELMLDDEQVRAYAAADFSEPNSRFITLLRERVVDLPLRGRALDLGCGPADLTIRIARALPEWTIDGVDGSEPMLALGRAAVTLAGLASRVRLHRARLPKPLPEKGVYDLVVSNSLLHHLDNPAVLWEAVRASVTRGGSVMVMDLSRPASRDEADALVATYASNELSVLRRDFFNSLCAAYRPDEVRSQLLRAGLGHLRLEVVSDRHFAVFGRFDRTAPGPAGLKIST